MATRAKPIPAPRRPVARKPRPLERAVQRVRAHPWLSWGTAASIVAVLGAVPIVSPYLPRWQTVEAAELNEKSHNKVHTDMLYGLARNETFLLRSQVNECETNPKLLKSPQDRRICAGYRAEYEQANDRMKLLQRQLMKEKP